MERRLLEEKNVIITGANRGIGKAILKEIAANGGNVWACARCYSEEFEDYIGCLQKEYSVWIRPVYFDLSDEKAIKEGVLGIIREKKPIDVLVNNAGVAYSGLMQMTPIEKLKEVFQINYFSQIQIMQMVSRIMVKQMQGNIINMASVGGMETNPGYLAYGSSKASLIWATQSIAKELGAYNIRVNAVAPGLTNTAMGNYKSKEELEKTINRTSLRRMAEPEEIAKTILFLASEEASFVTGQILRVDGGRL